MQPQGNNPEFRGGVIKLEDFSPTLFEWAEDERLFIMSCVCVEVLTELRISDVVTSYLGDLLPRKVAVQGRSSLLSLRDWVEGLGLCEAVCWRCGITEFIMLNFIKI